MGVTCHVLTEILILIDGIADFCAAMNSAPELIWNGTLCKVLYIKALIWRHVRLASALERAVVTAISDELRRLDSVDDSRSAISVVQGEILPLVIYPFRAVGRWNEASLAVGGAWALDRSNTSELASKICLYRDHGGRHLQIPARGGRYLQIPAG